MSKTFKMGAVKGFRWVDEENPLTPDDVGKRVVLEGKSSICFIVEYLTSVACGTAITITIEGLLLDYRFLPNGKVKKYPDPLYPEISPTILMVEESNENPS